MCATIALLLVSCALYHINSINKCVHLIGLVVKRRDNITTFLMNVRDNCSTFGESRVWQHFVPLLAVFRTLLAAFRTLFLQKMKGFGTLPGKTDSVLNLLNFR